MLVCKHCPRKFFSHSALLDHLTHPSLYIKCKKEYTEAEIKLLETTVRDGDMNRFQFEVEFEANLQDARNEIDFVTLNLKLQEMQLMFDCNETLFKCFKLLDVKLSLDVFKNIKFLEEERARHWVKRFFSDCNPLVLIKGKLYHRENEQFFLPSGVFWDDRYKKSRKFVQNTDLQKEIHFLKEEIEKVNINYGITTHEITLFPQDFVAECLSEFDTTLNELKDENNFELIESKTQELKKEINKRLVSLYLQLFVPVDAE